ncbi:chitobiase/beta-hexosaminidase C-terminal domain-containing protein [Sedimentisphaera salicampi]|uniref:chitobiase/beta-hexosaminidase C-terminal domain-containing protein n=1 Tax=Sedimentisphaera salicampi TaxID=1941349 RepID=UPI000B9B2C40|nr:chitobiase/beta-hexosaminidase C-terminal domain-containing protein [Sedimentisphaera salicampi]OXU15117.1 hypothetical protein SMSP1_01047 [Sedimentisphaera salicampi]
MQSTRFYISMVIAISASAAFSSQPRDLPNLLYDPSFESAQVSIAYTPEKVKLYKADIYDYEFEYWHNNPEMKFDSEKTHSGLLSMRIDGPSKGETSTRYGFSYTGSDNIKLLAGTEYILSVHLAGDVKGGGKGVHASFKQISPAELTLTKTKWVKESNWTKVSAKFTTPNNFQRGRIYLIWDIGEGEKVWVDDVSLVPANGEIKQVSTPEIKLRGEGDEGPVIAEIRTETPNAVIRHTIDGSEPTLYSPEVFGPIRLHGNANLKAAAFHEGCKTSEVAFREVKVNSRKTGGVPFNPVGFGEDVEQWWSRHIYNPESSNYFEKEIQSPDPVVNVGEIWKQNPSSVTAGIAEALKEIPKTGGTLFFDKKYGPYHITAPLQREKNYYDFTGSMLILRRGDLHFVSNGAVIKCDKMIFGFSSMEYADKGTLSNPPGNFYFKGLTFDGMGKADTAMIWRHGCDILFEGCTFRNYDQDALSHPGTVNITSNSDNAWFRNCRFLEAKNGLYLDGIHNAGVINCYFGPDIQHAGILNMTNNDMAPYSAFQRNSQYVVIHGNEFVGRKGVAMSLTNANTLISDNTASGEYDIFVYAQGRGKSNIVRNLRYNGSGYRIIGNVVENAETFLQLGRDIAQHTWHSFNMKNVVRDNNVRGNECFLKWSPVTDPHYPDYYLIENIEFRNNYISGEQMPQFIMDKDKRECMRNLEIYKNTFSGSRRPLKVTPKGEAVINPNIDFHSNTYK